MEHSPCFERMVNMDFTLMQYSGERNELYKTFSQTTVQLSGTLKNPSEVVNPVITVDSLTGQEGAFDPVMFNYAYIPEFRRYYWITDMRSIRSNLWEISLHSDVLMSFQSQVEDLAAYGMRTAKTSLQTAAIIDPQAPYAADDFVTRYDINTFTESPTYVLVTAG